MQNSKEQTLSILKPDATGRHITGAINNMLETGGLHIVAQKRIRLTKDEATAFYAVHSHQPFFDELCTVMSSGPVVVQVLEGDNAVAHHRALMGSTNPRDAEEGTVRQKFGISISENTVHGSDSLENAKTEIQFFFSQKEILGGRAS